MLKFQISRIEFEDPEDPESSCNQDGIRMTIAPEGLVLALPNGRSLGAEDQVMMGRLLRLSYEQGKAVGRLDSSVHSMANQDTQDD